MLPPGNTLGFKVDMPEALYNRGELYNLSIRQGTLTPEERYKINDHITQTIIMLSYLPLPKELARVPEIAGAQQSEAQIRRDADGQGDDDRRAASPQTPRVRADREVVHGAGDGDGEHHWQQHVGDARRYRAVQQQGTQPLRRVGQRRHEIVQHRDAGFPQPDDDERPCGDCWTG